MFYIYKVTNLINNKSYIGLTTNTIEKRWKSHCNKAKYSKDGTDLFPMDAAIRKYGPENFKVEEIAETEDFDELNMLEQKYVSEFNSLTPNGYNISIGGGQPSPKANSPESNEKRKEKMIANWENGIMTGFTGHHHTDKSKELISINNPNINGKYVLTPSREKHLKNLQQSNTGRIQPEEERKIRSNSAKAAWESGRRKPTHSGGRPPMSDEEKIQNSERQSGARWMHNNLAKLNLLVWKDEIDKMLENGWSLDKVSGYESIKRSDARKQNLI